jgi:FkbM family methyltransferase
MNDEKLAVASSSKLSIFQKFEEYAIELTPDHLLPAYQKNHPKYDRFLPVLVTYLERGCVIVDVGANVGDSLAAMAEKNKVASYICIEADELFFQILEKNVITIKKQLQELKVETLQALVGKAITGVVLEGKDGSKHAVLSKTGQIASRALDEILAGKSSIRLLKSDVDGFDYDVIDSAMGLIQKHKPILYFECQYENENQMAGYLSTLNQLTKVGYTDWTVFDNFGAKILRTKSEEMVGQLIAYIWQQNTHKTTRTIYYLDILVVQESDSVIIDKVLLDYN